MRVNNLIIIWILIQLIWLFGCQKDNIPPSIMIIEPEDGISVVRGDSIRIIVESNDETGNTPLVRVYINSMKIFSSAKPTFEITWKTDTNSLGNYTLKAVAEDIAGNIAYTTSDIYLIALEPSVSLDSIWNILPSSVSFSYSIPDVCGSDIVNSGICLSTQELPDINSIVFENNTNSKMVTDDLNDLIPQTTYHMRAFARNEIGVSYSNEIVFSTPTLSLPKVHLYEVRNISDSTVMIDWGITDDGGMTISECGICWSTSPGPIISDHYIKYYNFIPGDYTFKIEDLACGTTYYTRAFARNSHGLRYSNEMTFNTLDCGQEICKDYDENIYKVIKIGTQYWMAENLRVTHYKEGTAIPNVTEFTLWCMIEDGAYCNYNNDPNIVLTHGSLYNAYAVKDLKGLCPAGWHVPTDAEWKQLEIAIGMSSDDIDLSGVWRGQDENIGTKLKVDGGSGFDAKLSGNRGWYAPQDFKEINIYGVFWSSTPGTQYPETNHFARAFKDSENGVYRSEGNIHTGNSIRCIKD